MKLPTSNEEIARKVADSVLSPERIKAMDAIQAQHVVIKSAQVLCQTEATRQLGFALFTVAAWLAPQAQQQGKPTVVCLCGSTRFADAFHECNLRETLAGKIVLSIGCNTRSDQDLLLAGELTEEDKVRLDELHKRKIDLCDEILVLNVGGYVGPSTQSEIAYARAHDKRVRWLEEEQAQ